MDILIPSHTPLLIIYVVWLLTIWNYDGYSLAEHTLVHIFCFDDHDITLVCMDMWLERA